MQQSLIEARVVGHYIVRKPYLENANVTDKCKEKGNSFSKKNPHTPPPFK